MNKSFLFRIIVLLFLLSTWSYSAIGQPDIEWSKNYGGFDNDRLRSFHLTMDDGYILSGSTWSFEGDVIDNNGNSDYWIVRLDLSGNIGWERNLGGTLFDENAYVRPTTDGGYLVVGWSSSSDGMVSGNNGDNDYWLVKLDAYGTIEWETNLGGGLLDEPKAIELTTDGGYLIAGSSFSNDGDVINNNGEWDYWIVKLDFSGILEWEKNYGGSATDIASCMVQTMDGGYIIGGSSWSSDGDVSANNGISDVWIVKTDAAGNIQWERNFGGSQRESPNAIRQTTDGGYILACSSQSTDGDISGNFGSYDYWILKLDMNGDMKWEKSLGALKTIEQTIFTKRLMEDTLLREVHNLMMAT